MGTREGWFEWTANSTDIHAISVEPHSWWSDWSLTALDNCGGTVLDCAYFNTRFDDNRIQVSAVAGNTYMIRVSPEIEFDGVLTIEPFGLDPFDNCGDAKVISGYGTFSFDREFSTSDPQSENGCGSIGSDTWLAWTAPQTRYVEISSDALNRFTLLDGCGGQELYCRPDVSPNPFRLGLHAQAGETYWMQMGTYDSNVYHPTGTITIDFPVPTVRPVSGHAYIQQLKELDWFASAAEAQASIFRGRPGHLVTIGDAAESDHVTNLMATNKSWMGLYQDFWDPNYSEPLGGWKWVTGEPLNYTHWALPHQPNDSPTGEDVARIGVGGRWDDSPGTLPQSFLVEWDFDPVGSTFCDAAATNSMGLACYLGALNSTSSPSGVRLEASDGPTGQFAYFLVGNTTQEPGLAWAMVPCAWARQRRA